MTPMQSQIYHAIRAAGRVRSLLKLTVQMGIPYCHAWHAVAHLERNGLVSVERNSGLPLIITVSRGHGMDHFGDIAPHNA